MYTFLSLSACLCLLSLLVNFPASLFLSLYTSCSWHPCSSIRLSAVSLSSSVSGFVCLLAGVRLIEIIAQPEQMRVIISRRYQRRVEQLVLTQLAEIITCLTLKDNFSQHPRRHHPSPSTISNSSNISVGPTEVNSIDLADGIRCGCWSL